MGPAARVLSSSQWIVRTVAAALAIAACLAAAVWQYHRTQDQLTVARAALSQLAPYAEVVPPGTQELTVDMLGRNVAVAGEVLPDARTLIRDRLSQDDQVGYLVVDGVRLDDGRIVAVLQGWTPDPRSAPVLAGEQIQVTGRVQPYENFYPQAPISDSGPLLTITAAGLAAQWGGQAPLDGYVTVTGRPAAPGLGAVTPLVGTDPDVSFPLQNAFYSLQWLIFAAVIAFMWFRFLRDDIRDARTKPPSTDVGSSDDRVSLG